MAKRHSGALISLTLLLSFCLAMCAGAKDTLVAYQTKNRLFSFTYPSSWKVDEINELTVIVIEPQNLDYRARFSLMAQLLPQPINAKQYLEISLVQLRSIYADFELLKIDSVSFSGSKARTIEAKYTENGESLHGYSAFLVVQPYVFIFNGIAQDDKWKNAVGCFTESLSSVSIELPATSEPPEKDGKI